MTYNVLYNLTMLLVFYIGFVAGSVLFEIVFTGYFIFLFITILAAMLFGTDKDYKSIYRDVKKRTQLPLYKKLIINIVFISVNIYMFGVLFFNGYYFPLLIMILTYLLVLKLHEIGKRLCLCGGDGGDDCGDWFYFFSKVFMKSFTSSPSVGYLSSDFSTIIRTAL